MEIYSKTIRVSKILFLPFLIFGFLIESNLLNAQVLDKALIGRSDEIVKFLQTEEGLLDSVDNTHFKDAVYSRTIFSQDNLKMFQIGMIASHSRRYLAILGEKKLTFYKSNSLVQDLPEILHYLEIKLNKRYQASDIIALMKEITSIYSYNLSPPWSEKR